MFTDRQGAAFCATCSSMTMAAGFKTSLCSTALSRRSSKPKRKQLVLKDGNGYQSQGARLIGAYDNQVTFGQSRVLLVWTRLIMPNGRSIVLERQPGADAAGYAGLEDQVNNHWGELFKARRFRPFLPSVPNWVP